MSKPDIPTPEECPGTSSAAPIPLTRREARAAEQAAGRIPMGQAAEKPTAAEQTPTLTQVGKPLSVAAAVPILETAAMPTGMSVNMPVVPSAETPAARERLATSTSRRPAHPETVRPAAEPTRSRQLSRRALGFATFSVVGGLFATAAIPAYGARSASGSGTGSAAARHGDLQNLTVSAEANGQTAVRDAFAAPTQAQLDEASRQAAVLSGSNGGEFSTVKTRAVGDDYPWPHETIDDNGGGLSPLGYYYRECVDFIAWRLNRDAGRTSAPWKYTWSAITPLGGSAYEWPDNWAAKGWATSSVPIVGCVAWWTYNHVSYVQKINDNGTVLLEEYNYGGKHSYVTRTFPTAKVPLFLYPPAL